MNPHVACKLCELEKHLLEPWYVVFKEIRRRGEAIAEIARIVNASIVRVVGAGG